MNPRIALLLAAGVAVAVVAATRKDHRPKAAGPPQRLEKVLDPDRILVTHRNDGLLTVRMRGISVPHRGERGYQEAKNALWKLLGGQRNVYLEYETDARKEDGDDFAYVWTEDELLNVELVRSGWALVDRESASKRYLGLLTEAEKQAREEGKGLWNSKPEAAAEIDEED